MKFVGLIEKLEQKICVCIQQRLHGDRTLWELAGKQMNTQTHAHKRKRKYTMGDLSIWAVYLYSHLSPIYPADNIIPVQYIVLDNFY